jgi:hypothetical protein
VKVSFANMFFLLFPCKKYIYIYPKVALEMQVLNCVKILGKTVKIKGVYVIL